MQHLLSEIALVAPSEATVLIPTAIPAPVKCGSRGRFTPVAHVAKNRQRSTVRHDESLLESELFGHEKGRLLEPINAGKGALLRRTAARCFSIKLAILADDAGASAACIQEREVQRVGSNQISRLMSGLLRRPIAILPQR
ncbi:hypothetical protein ACVXHB_02455 [Escherichia coli]